MGGNFSADEGTLKVPKRETATKLKMQSSASFDALQQSRRQNSFARLEDVFSGGLRADTREQSVNDLLKVWDDRRLDRSNSKKIEISEEDVLRLKWIEMSGWYHGAGKGPDEDLGSWLQRGNVEDWIGHYFFRGLVPRDMGRSERTELVSLTDLLLAHLGLPDLREGRNERIQPWLILSDPLECMHRPLFMYGVTTVACPLLTSQVMPWLGFKKERIGALDYWHRGPRSNISPNSDIAGGRHIPLVILHGLGVGLVPYYVFIYWLSQRYTFDIFVPEFPFFACRPYESVPSSREAVAQLQDMLAADGHRAGYFLGHSFGCIVAWWMQKLAPSSVLCLTVLEPATFLMLSSDTLRERVHGKSQTCLEICYRYFAFRELFTMNLLCRNFFWEQCTMWPEDLKVPTLVQLASDDAVIHARSVRRVIEYERASRSRNKPRGSVSAAHPSGSSADLRKDPLQGLANGGPNNAPLEIMWSEGFFHGMILGHKKESEKLFKKMKTLMAHLK
jgi:pimeloyl-ACP methyl ester carboxylesterase